MLEVTVLHCTCRAEVRKSLRHYITPDSRPGMISWYYREARMSLWDGPLRSPIYRGMRGVNDQSYANQARETLW